MKKTFLLLACCAFFFASCTTTSKALYSWHNYEDASYQYQKKGSDELFAKAMAEYLKVIEKQRGTRKTVPPGLNAEYGYMLYKSGKAAEGIAFLKKEIALYPESEVYISRIIKQLEQ
ncbi:MAG: DUF4810 domain-containing protein [Alphaproteobacteria bacterium]|nr:DUF4810 domain-containing protein [Alphaproteobacteria bacterium]